jgi:hypothetical protein
MGRRQIFHTFSLLVEIVGHFAQEFVSYVYETEDCYDNCTLVKIKIKTSHGPKEGPKEVP